METKNCTTCKFEPEWDKNNIGKCKILPEFITISFHNENTPDIYAYNETFRSERIVKDCNLWETKE